MKHTPGWHWQRLKRSLGRRYREWRLPRGYMRLGTKYGGWWIDSRALGMNPLLVDCGLGLDLSFPAAFIERFGGTVIGIEPNPQSIRYCEAHRPRLMQVWPCAFWTRSGERLTFHLPRPPDRLPKGADGISGSLVASHEYAGDESVEVLTTSLDDVLARTGRNECDVLKLDIEGAEYDVLNDLCSSGAIRKARQLLVEFHHGVTAHSLSDTANALGDLERSGFELVHVEGRNHILRRTDRD